MKKKVLSFMLVCLAAVCLTACGREKSDTGQMETKQETKAGDADYMYNYLKGMSSAQERKEFLNFWNFSVAYCKGIKIQLKKIKNEVAYEFDPTDETQIPAEIKDIYDFSEIKEYGRKGRHKNIKISIDRMDVRLSFDGIEFYPTTYGYSDLQKYIAEIDAE